MNNGRLNTVKRIAYLLLVLWVCGVGPLMYFERFSSHQIGQKNQPLVLGYTVGHSPHLPAELLAALGRTPKPNASMDHGPQLTQAVLGLANGVPQFYLSVFKDGHVLAAIGLILLVVALVAGKTRNPASDGDSAVVPPPDRPPTFLFRLNLA